MGKSPTKDNFVEDFCIYTQRYWLVIFFICNIFVWHWYRGNWPHRMNLGVSLPLQFFFFGGGIAWEGWASLVAQLVRIACNVGDLGLIPGLGRYPGEGKCYPLQYSGLENPMDYIVHGVAKSQIGLSDLHCTWEG